ncbi:phosphatidylinositol 4-phosphate 5-kinase-like protein 1 [Pseudoliparis swirei]|uniref:phosphatidylinositol 4-phosphate 5-kinase-like protein 1 n=1 Tax=Pseudoliparis swirei TaxID=2059687 RepID=UPI0024BE3329|nr:phosphatidylinositol 4-phosphate 5-kinase-like protein 1 [Pseudoliparis swirei]XP_056288456.1 phosphatidylinositol 4-phosphate 5-kinase-like protein 1 [Pseudoliparis swirei]
METSAGGQARRRRLWGGWRQQLLGLFEIQQQHEFYSLTCMMREGLAAACRPTKTSSPTNELTDEDYRSEVTQVHKGFTMASYAGPVFSSLRASLLIPQLDYERSLCSERNYLQFISNSKSRADFFLTNDKRFFLKTQTKREVQFLLTNLKIYMEHLREFPHSLLVKFLGTHTHTHTHTHTRTSEMFDSSSVEHVLILMSESV